MTRDEQLIRTDQARQIATRGRVAFLEVYRHERPAAWQDYLSGASWPLPQAPLPRHGSRIDWANHVRDGVAYCVASLVRYLLGVL